jgi:hypothetical protein
MLFNDFQDQKWNKSGKKSTQYTPSEAHNNATSNKPSVKKDLDTSFSEKVKQDTNKKSEFKGDKEDSLLELMEQISGNDHRGKEELAGSPNRADKPFMNSLDSANISPIVGSNKKGNEDIDKFFGFAGS